ncbi:Postacrosomal sheath WW domain-binding protein [Hondaea fermentalgiana]|uniref:Postacrosomal sheath WW domain-binding protein n=1 Tax=Hondaea fermentalgiana TaxID=2315210 RepID=A0A2R5GDF2_9STRA|nr:Postacrosomal sheath WW domain-binding protein [Hondaea fermentalgiana]|eukprot:GBG28990.1 Postacrosomal sheath WW domain-binding protein [Hondaea fermentalgiana]
MYDARTPMSKVGEFFLVQREGVSVEIACDGLPKLKASSGILYLTTLRIVFVATPPKALDHGAEFKSFEFSLSKIEDEKFNQPIFGANNLGGTLHPTQGMGLTVDARFKLFFKQGGAGTLLPLFFRALLDARRGGAQSIAEAIQAGRFASMAVADPSDPSVVYLTQPDIPVATEVSADEVDAEDDHPDAAGDDKGARRRNNGGANGPTNL